MQKIILVFFLSLFFGVGCESGPSKNDVVAAHAKLIEQLNKKTMGALQVKSEILEVTECKKSKKYEDGYTCYVKIESEVDSIFGTEKDSGIKAIELVKIGDEWIIKE